MDWLGYGLLILMAFICFRIESNKDKLKKLQEEVNFQNSLNDEELVRHLLEKRAAEKRLKKVADAMEWARRKAESEERRRILKEYEEQLIVNPNL